MVNTLARSPYFSGVTRGCSFGGATPPIPCMVSINPASADTESIIESCSCDKQDGCNGAIQQELNAKGTYIRTREKPYLKISFLDEFNSSTARPQTFYFPMRQMYSKWFIPMLFQNSTFTQSRNCTSILNKDKVHGQIKLFFACLLYTSPSPRD